MKKLLIILIALLLLLCSCANDPMSGENTSDATEVPATEPVQKNPVNEDPPAVDEMIALMKDGDVRFNIVPYDERYSELAVSLQTQLKIVTGSSFAIYKFAPKKASLKNFYVGYPYETVVEGGDKETRGIVLKDGDLYLCAANLYDAGVVFEKLSKTVIPVGAATKDDNGKMQCQIYASMLFTEIPDESEKLSSGISMLGERLDQFRLILSEDATALDRYLAKFISDIIDQIMGIPPVIATDAEDAVDAEIVIGQTSRSGSSVFYAGEPDVVDYSLKSDGKTLYIGVGSILAVNDVKKEFRSIYENDLRTVDIAGEAKDTYALQKQEESDIRVMTHNVLVCGWEVDPWKGISGEDRMELCAETYNFFLPDFVGLQEYPDANRKKLEKHLDERYESVAFTDTLRTAYHGILYRSDLWRLVKEDAWKNFPAEDVNRAMPWGFQYAIFERTDGSGDQFILFNLHYTFDPVQYPGYYSECAVDLNQTIGELMSQYPDTPMAVTGDFNSFVKGYDVVGDTIGSLPLQTSFEMTDNNNHRGGMVDHVLVTSDRADVVQMRVLYLHPLDLASDHKPHFADIRLKSAQS